MMVRAASSQAFPESVARLRAALDADESVGPAHWRALESLDWATPLPNSAAPGFVYLAGSRRGSAVGGGGVTMAEAATRLAGETAETLAQELTPAIVDLPRDAAIEAVWGGGPRIAAWRAPSGEAVAAPACAIYTAWEAAPGAPPRSLGLGAGPDLDAARLAGLMELVERDAAAAWWRGGVPPRAVCATAAAAAAAMVAACRTGARTVRPTVFLALPSPTGAPVACAMSRDATGGAGLAFGFRAAADMPAALAGAARELMQMEIALELSRLRAAGPRQSHGPDAAVLGRADLAADRFAAFAALPPEPPARPWATGFAATAARLAAKGFEITVADLPAPAGGLAVAKVFAPALRPLPGPGPAPVPGSPGATADLM